MSKSTARDALDCAAEALRDAINRASSIKRTRDARRMGRIVRKGATLYVKV